MRRAVNTLLFRIWENQPIVEPANQYPYLFRNMTDGDNSCQGANSPYRLGSVDVGWNELARYDRRVLYIMERLTDALVDGEAAISFPAPADCTLSGNTNYSYIITAIAELAYAHTYTVPSTAGSPLLLTSAANVSVAENRTAVLTVMTTAAAGTTPTFLLNGGADAAWFAIDSATGVLTFTSGRDYEAAVDADTDNDYLVTVMVSDGVNAASQDLTVTVTDVGENPVGPITDADALANQVAEDVVTWTAVNLTALAVDPDGDTVTYTLDDNAGGRFTIHATTGVVAVAASTLLDHEAAASHDITIRATSWDFSETSATFTINVTDVNEDPISAISDTDVAANAVA